MIPHLLLIVVTTTTVSSSAMDYTCTPGVQPSPGVSLPRGDVSQEVGGPPLTLTCHLNPGHEYYAVQGLRGKDLFFEMDRVKLNTTIVNDTTIREERSLPLYYISC